MNPAKRRKLSDEHLGLFTSLPNEILHVILFHLLENTTTSICLKHVYQFFSTCKGAMALKADFFYQVQCRLSIYDIQWYRQPSLKKSRSPKRAEDVICQFAFAKNSCRKIVNMCLEFREIHKTFFQKNRYSFYDMLEKPQKSCINMESHISVALTLGHASPLKLFLEMQPLGIEPFCDDIKFHTLFVSPWKFFLSTYQESMIILRPPQLEPGNALMYLVCTVGNHLELLSKIKRPIDELENILIEVAKVVGEKYRCMFVLLLVTWGMTSYSPVNVIREYFHHFKKFGIEDIHTLFHFEDYLLKHTSNVLIYSDLFIHPMICNPLRREVFDLFVDNIAGDDFCKFKKLLGEYVSDMMEWVDEYTVNPVHASNLTLIFNHFNSSWGVTSWQNILSDEEIEYIFPTTIEKDDGDQDHAHIHSVGDDCGNIKNGHVVRLAGCRDHWMFSTFILDTGIEALARLPRYATESHSAILHNFAPWAMAHPNSNLITVGDGQSLVACKYKENHIDEWQEDKGMMITWMRNRGVRV